MTDPSLLVWYNFAACVVIIGIAGVKLTEYGDSIADKTGMGGTWIGLVLIATVTSLPELAAGITATAVALLPDIAAGDALGSCVYNLLILAIMDLFNRDQPVLTAAGREHVLSGGFSVLLIGFAAIGILAAGLGQTALIAHIGWTTPILIILYIVAIRSLYRFQEEEVETFTEQEPDRFAGLTLTQVSIRYGLAAAAVVAAGIWLPYVSEDLSVAMGWNQSFTGTIFTAMSTSLPELVVTLTCVRIGAINLAVGNIFGSNLFNMLVLAVDDLFYLEGPLANGISQAHLVSAVTAMTMTGAVIAALYFRARVRVLRIGGWTSILLLILFSINSWLLFKLGSPEHL